MKHWLEVNGRSKQVSTDLWYLDFANRLLPLINRSPLYEKRGETDRANAALHFALYLQDSIVQTGGWKEFSNAYHQLYQAYLPFYHLSDVYVPDEINVEDISFIQWTLLSRLTDAKESPAVIQNPYAPDLLEFSEELYHVMDASFEEAPICDEPSSPAWIMRTDLLKMPHTPLPEITLGMTLKKDVEKCLAYSQGAPLLYFPTYDLLHKFFIEELGWESKNIFPELSHETDFVIYANAKGMLIAYDVAYCFCDPANPTYDAEKAATQGYHLFIHQGQCPFDLLKYGMAKHLFPDLQFPFPRGKEVLHEYWDFITRYFLREYYEESELE